MSKLPVNYVREVPREELVSYVGELKILLKTGWNLAGWVTRQSVRLHKLISTETKSNWDSEREGSKFPSYWVLYVRMATFSWVNCILSSLEREAFDLTFGMVKVTKNINSTTIVLKGRLFNQKVQTIVTGNFVNENCTTTTGNAFSWGRVPVRTCGRQMLPFPSKIKNNFSGISQPMPWL